MSKNHLNFWFRYETVLKSLVLEHLPDSIRTILAVSDSKDLDNLALLADKIYENQTPRAMIWDQLRAHVNSLALSNNNQTRETSHSV